MRKRRHSLWPIATLCTMSIVTIAGNVPLIAQLTGTSDQNQPRYPILAACSGKDSDLFTVTEEWLKDGGKTRIAEILGQPDMNEPNAETEEQKNAVELWQEQYHTIVAAIAASAANQPSEPDCLSENLMPAPDPDDALYKLAEHLAPWKEADAREQLTTDDVWTVLLEYLREYECALVERYFYLFSDAIAEQGVQTGNVAFHWNEVFEAYFKQYPLIRSELQSARPALHRTITLLHGNKSMHRISREVQCLYRASKDIRNAFALGAETAACFPRVQDAKDPLRDREPIQITR